jgi:hypothetical protein
MEFAAAFAVRVQTQKAAQPAKEKIAAQRVTQFQCIRLTSRVSGEDFM